MPTLTDTEPRSKSSGIYYGDREVFLYPIEDVLSLFSSVEWRAIANDQGVDDEDDLYYSPVGEFLYYFRGDERYHEALDFLRDGFRQPLISVINYPRLADGHHRLAAAVDLGYSVIPVMFGTNDTYYSNTIIDPIVTKETVWE